MLGILCVLALLAGVILFALHPALTGWPTLTRILRPLRLTVAALAPPNPPSLHVLSISRTWFVRSGPPRPYSPHRVPEFCYST